MAYRKPTSRKAKRTEEGINLIPILDAVFIFIFFLLMSTQFVKIFEISSDIPIISNQEPPKKKDKKLLGLTLEITNTRLVLSSGNPARVIAKIGKNSDGEYDLDQLHEFLIGLKKKHISSRIKYVDPDSIVIEPKADVEYEIIVNIMDAVRKLKNTDDAMFRKDKDGIDTQLKFLFHKIIFGNIMS